MNHEFVIINQNVGTKNRIKLAQNGCTVYVGRIFIGRPHKQMSNMLKIQTWQKAQ